jgi:hypothetical protein
MKREERDRLDRLLARGRMSRPEKERMFDEVTRAAERPASRRWLTALRFAIPALAVLVLVPFLMLRHHDAGFAAKGEASHARIEAACAGGCRPGAKLVFRTSDVATASVLAAWSEVGGERVWYFPSASGELPKIAPHQSPELVSRAVQVGEHDPPHATLTMMLLPDGSYTREQILKLDAPRVQQPLEIAP